MTDCSSVAYFSLRIKKPAVAGGLLQQTFYKTVMLQVDHPIDGQPANGAMLSRGQYLSTCCFLLNLAGNQPLLDDGKQVIDDPVQYQSRRKP